jgi:hypothetical protein
MDTNPPPESEPRSEGHSYRHSPADRVDAHALWLDAQAAAHALRLALGAHGVVLPSLGADHGGPVSGVNLVDLGRVRPDVARALAAVILPRPER